MFGGAGDPFGNPFQFMRHQMQEMDAMMNSMMGPFFGVGDPRAAQQMLTNGDNHGHHPHHRSGANQHQIAHPMDNMMLNPFGMGGGLFGGFGSLMHQQMEQMGQRAMTDPHATVFTQSTMISFDGDGQPKVVSNSTRKAGEVKETRRQVQHGPQIEELVVGHSIGDRSHVIEKKRDREGRLRKQQKFINMDQAEAEDFNEEFKSRAQQNLSSSGLGRIYASIGGAPRDQHRAIGNGGAGGHRANQRVRGRTQAHESSGPIVTVPDDDEDDDIQMVEERPARSSGAYRHGRDNYQPHYGDGPTIREVTEDDERDAERSKRRKGGLFGKFT